MKIHEYNEMMRYLTRPKDILSKEEKKEVVKSFYKKAEVPKTKPMPIVKYIDKMNRLYGHDPSATDEYGNEESATDRIQEQARNKKYKIVPNNIGKSTPPKNEPKEPIVEKAPKRIAKKSLPKDWKPQYLNGNVINMTPLIDDEWWSIFGEDPPKEDDVRVPTKTDIEKILNIKRKEVAGLEAILSPGRKQT